VYRVEWDERIAYANTKREALRMRDGDETEDLLPLVVEPVDAAGECDRLAEEVASAERTVQRLRPAHRALRRGR
jgi:hypothetical protein